MLYHTCALFLLLSGNSLCVINPVHPVSLFKSPGKVPPCRSGTSVLLVPQLHGNGCVKASSLPAKDPGCFLPCWTLCCHKGCPHDATGLSEPSPGDLCRVPCVRGCPPHVLGSSEAQPLASAPSLEAPWQRPTSGRTTAQSPSAHPAPLCTSPGLFRGVCYSITHFPRPRLPQSSPLACALPPKCMGVPPS